MGQYAFDSSDRREQGRLAAIESVHDPVTIRHLEALGVDAGWRCLEVGAGGGSIVRWLCRRVGPTGRVVATDLDTRHLEGIGEPNLEVRRHDITSDELEEASFDLVHARLVLEHLPERDSVLKCLVSTLKPSGRLLVEDYDWSALLAYPPIVFVHPPDEARQSIRIWRAAVRLMESVGYDPTYGRRLPGELLKVGMTDVGAEGRMILIRGGTPTARVPHGTLERLRKPLLKTGALTEREIAREIKQLADPERAAMVYFLVSAWGSRPAQRSITDGFEAHGEAPGRLLREGDTWNA